MSDEYPKIICPQCLDKTEDMDGFGFLYCDKCKFCTHPSCSGKAGEMKCDMCGKEDTPMTENAREWQPIETAPKDGTEIFGRWVNETEIHFAHVHYASDFTGEYQPMFSGWFMPCDSGYTEVHPTHWKPLPE